jgi:hypothetical protein
LPRLEVARFQHLITLPDEVVAECKRNFKLAMEKSKDMRPKGSWGTNINEFPMWTKKFHTVSNAKALNKIAGITNNQYKAMLCGSMFGFDVPGE